MSLVYELLATPSIILWMGKETTREWANATDEERDNFIADMEVISEYECCDGRGPLKV